MSVLIPDKIKQMGIDKNYKLVDAVDVEIDSDDYTDVQDFVDNFADKIDGFVAFKRDGNNSPILGTSGNFAISNGDGTISFTATSSAVDPDLIAEDGTKFRFGVNNGAFGYIITNSETGNDQFIPFKTGDGGGSGEDAIISSYKILWQSNSLWSPIMILEHVDRCIIAPYIDKTYDEEDD